MTCPSCSASSPERVFDGPRGAWSLWHCSVCSAYPVFPFPERTVLYKKDYFELGDVPASASYSGYVSYDRYRDVLRSDFMEALRPHVRKEMRILDIGCATGTALEAARELGVPEAHLSGIDVSSYAIDVATQRLPQGHLILADVETTELGGPYELILMFDVLEHLRHPAELMRHAASALVPGGRIIATTPDPESVLRKISGASWSEFRYGEHLCFVGRGWFSWIAKETGMRLVQVRRHGKRVTLEHAASRLRAYLPFFPRLKSQRIVRLNTHDQLLVVCERPL